MLDSAELELGFSLPHAPPNSKPPELLAQAFGLVGMFVFGAFTCGLLLGRSVSQEVGGIRVALGVWKSISVDFLRRKLFVNETPQTEAHRQESGSLRESILAASVRP